MSKKRINAVIVNQWKQVLPDGAINYGVIWLLPEPTPDRPHGYKHRLNYSLPNGKSLVRYDTEAGKGDHKHLKDKEYTYNFTDLNQLLKDYRADILKLGGIL